MARSGFRRGYAESLRNIEKDTRKARSHVKEAIPFAFPQPIPLQVASLISRGLLLGKKMYGHI
jgi:hypothetical protein